MNSGKSIFLTHSSVEDLSPLPFFIETGSTNDAGEEGSQEKLEKAGLASLD